ncbi:MAG: peptidoglycan DD-metalloendopeptidase family protein [Rhodospirillales bacterium]|jgi:murein DD-endopeptidase MepM/ murein hydrolase activator NlpD|nr:peptidoglycan DD-metalloendopeptidase family protein [Rhodospirillales bacterium]
MRRKDLWQQEPKRFRRLIHRLFPERQLHIRTEGRVSYYRLSRGSQIAFIVVLALIGGWGTFSSVSFVLHDVVLGAKESQLASARVAYRSLLDEVGKYQKRFSSITRDLEENHGLMLSVVEQNAALQQSLKSVEGQLKSTERERARVIAAWQELIRQLAGVEDKMRGVAEHNFTLRGNLYSTEADLQTALAERNESIFNSNRMRRQIKQLETRLSDLQVDQVESVQRLAEGTAAFIDDMEKVVSIAGLKVNRLLKADASLAKGQGGPFIEAKPDGLPGDRLRVELENLDTRLNRWEALQTVIRRLPLTAPLDYFYITSAYGKRRDPLNKRWAAHYGVDLGSSFKSSVFATAPGVVTYAGWKGKYGRLIEIDHGAGIKTRYGHLNKTLVKKGQEVKFRQKIGLLGNSGRSTGRHLHYEVVFKNRPKNPMKFIKAGRYVFQE